MRAENSELEKPSYEELLRQNNALRQEVDYLRSLHSEYLWGVYADTSRKLQVYSASIKAAVSSLLDRDIFWDGANQHEFLTTINASVNQVSDLTILLTLAFRAEAGNLMLKCEPQPLQEILSVSQDSAREKFPDLHIEIAYPQDGDMALVDYDYFTKALMLLFEILSIRKFSESILITASETENSWRLDIAGIPSVLTKTIEQMHNCKTQSVNTGSFSTENILRMQIICEVLHLQNVLMDILEMPDRPHILRLSIPAVANTLKRLE